MLPALFPDHKRAAVSLTYDDGHHNHIDVAAPDLQAAGFRGTFFLHTGLPPCHPLRVDDWRAVEAAGHEIGNHTRTHPCPLSVNVNKPNFASEAYNIPRIEQELIDCESDLNRITLREQGERSFAYPCGCDWVGPDQVSYREIVRRRFSAARLTGDAPNDPATIDLHGVKAFVLMESVAHARIVQWINAAIENGQWLVFCLHNIAQGHRLDLSRTRHAAVLKELSSRSANIHVGTFGSVARHLASQR